MVQYIHYHSQIGEGKIVRKYWNKGRLKASWINSKLCISISDIKMLFRYLTPFTFIHYSAISSSC